MTPTTIAGTSYSARTRARLGRGRWRRLGPPSILKLQAGDVRNVDLKEAAKPLQLDGAQARLLQAAGASNLADIATVLRKRLGAAP